MIYRAETCLQIPRPSCRAERNRPCRARVDRVRKAHRLRHQDVRRQDDALFLGGELWPDISRTQAPGATRHNLCMRLDHIVLWTKDPRAAMDFYSKVVGLTPVRFDEFEAGQAPFPSVRVCEDSIIDLIAGGQRCRYRVDDEGRGQCRPSGQSRLHSAVEVRIRRTGSASAGRGRGHQCAAEQYLRRPRMGSAGLLLLPTRTATWSRRATTSDTRCAELRTAALLLAAVAALRVLTILRARPAAPGSAGACDRSGHDGGDPLRPALPGWRSPSGTTVATRCARLCRSWRSPRAVTWTFPAACTRGRTWPTRPMIDEPEKRDPHRHGDRCRGAARLVVLLLQ